MSGASVKKKRPAADNFQNSTVERENACDTMMNSAVADKNGLKIVESVRANSIAARCSRISMTLGGELECSCAGVASRIGTPLAWTSEAPCHREISFRRRTV